MDKTIVIGSIRNNSNRNLIVYLDKNQVISDFRLARTGRFYLAKAKTDVDVFVPHIPDGPPTDRWYFYFFDSDSIKNFMDNKYPLHDSTYEVFSKYLLKREIVTKEIIANKSIRLTFK